MHITIKNSYGQTQHLQAQQGQSLAQAIWLSGLLPTPALCSGLGRCSRCMVRFEDHAPPPSVEEIPLVGDKVTKGWRLAFKLSVEERTQPVIGFLPVIPLAADRHLFSY